MRIASLSPAVTEILFAIGAGNSVVCVDQFSDEPDAAKSVPHLKDHQKIDLDALAEHKPEIVFTSTVVQQRLAEELRSAGKWAVIHQDPRSIGDVYESIRAVGVIAGKEREAHALVTMMVKGFSDVRKKAALLPKKVKVYVEEWHHPPMVSGNWVPEVVRESGGVPFDIGSITEEVGTRKYEGRDGRNPLSREVSLAEIQAFDPDMIVLSICGAGKFADKDLLMKRDGWSQLRAVAEGRLFVIDDSLLNRPGPRLVMGAQRIYGWLFQGMH